MSKTAWNLFHIKDAHQYTFHSSRSTQHLHDWCRQKDGTQGFLQRWMTLGGLDTTVITCTNSALTLSLSSTLISPKIECIKEVNLLGPFALVTFLLVVSWWKLHFSAIGFNSHDTKKEQELYTQNPVLPLFLGSLLSMVGTACAFLTHCYTSRVWDSPQPQSFEAIGESGGFLQTSNHSASFPPHHMK